MENKINKIERKRDGKKMKYLLVEFRSENQISNNKSRYMHISMNKGWILNRTWKVVHCSIKVSPKCEVGNGVREIVEYVVVVVVATC